MIGGIRIAIDRWMRDEHTGLAPHIALYLLSILYGASVRMRASLFAIGLIKTKRLPCRVVSIGNLTVGGSGKTPMVMHMADILQKKGRRVVILCRGYKGSAKGVNAVSDGRTVLLGYKEAGDEPYLLARRLKGVPVVVGRDRYKSGLYAIEAFSPDVILLDDGFQHIRLARDVNILLVDSKEGFGNGHLLPRGLL
ncbi:MAG: tetraacyldisaccharide 4'-kinase, partial [Deltaproteobacteria bacterium]|nr:tetraacyldisaccharide 4'-kinase [Deltaproteobacteria bacterium]